MISECVIPLLAHVGGLKNCNSMTREEAKLNALNHYPDFDGPCDKPNAYADDYRLTLAQRYAYMRCYDDMLLNNDKYQTVPVEQLDILVEKAKAYDEFIAEKPMEVPALGTKYDANIHTRKAYKDGCRNTDKKYKKLVDYCKGTLYLWGVEHDNVLSELGDLLKNLEK